MIIHIATHGKHQKGGNSAENYDGPLTQEGWEAASKIQVSKDYYDLIFVGAMKRHKETAMAMGLLDKAVKMSKIGDDEKIFAIYDGDETVVDDFRVFLTGLFIEGYQKVLLITSRGYQIFLQYILGGGKKKFGSAKHFLNMDGAKIPLMEQGALLTFEFYI